MADIFKLTGSHIVTWAPFGADSVEVEFVDRLLQAGIIRVITQDEYDAMTPGNFLGNATERGNVLYRVNDGFDGEDFRLAVSTLQEREQQARRKRVLGALGD